MKNVTVADLMKREPIIVNPDTDLIECARKMVRKKAKIIFLANKDKIFKGVLSRHDILWALVKIPKADLAKVKASEISPKKIIKLRPSDSIEKMMKKVRETKFYRYPVIDEEKIIGIITVKDILNFKPEIYPEFEEIDKIKEEGERLKRIEEEKIGKSGKEGICEECGNSDSLFRHNGMMICSGCIQE